MGLRRHDRRGRGPSTSVESRLIILQHPSNGGKPVVSILSSVFNESVHLKEMIDSVIAQDLTEWELLLVDDASTDDTVDIIRRASDADPRVRLVSTGVKLGKVAAFNLAFSQSRGDLIVLMGGDDTMPPDSLSGRAAAIPESKRSIKVAGYFKLLSMSDSPRFDKMLLPRGTAGSRSGPSITMTRPLAEMCFPVPEELPSEDTWLGELTHLLADEVVNSPHVVVNYRIHAANSNPRHKDFGTMSESMHRRAKAIDLILENPAFDLSPASRAHLRSHVAVEELRYRGKTFKLLSQRGMPLVDRLANASMSSPALFSVRTRFYRYFSGWRGR
ncbi:glycosyltransferase family 2 protein [Microbacterium sp. ARD31]|uniref:glycosyltransferase family 2 protein n=1 Tax=Microbacterium sp. ARD31 TaxID=2962576 RepID=UPI0028827557|nr:glycosyltransferase family 2 protein [Microbacterium sp. ARD31]MDT0183372.1 glycosyltransferase family 2 protein [Microbacterium sp. ARD31]